jgi:hypothetical protein
VGGAAAPISQKTSLKPEEIDQLYDGMRACPLEAIEKVREHMGEDIHLKPQRWKQIEHVMLSPNLIWSPPQ